MRVMVKGRKMARNDQLQRGTIERETRMKLAVERFECQKLGEVEV